MTARHWRIFIATIAGLVITVCVMSLLVKAATTT